MELKPCPFCGGEAKHVSLSGLLHGVECRSCAWSVLPVLASEEDAARVWNTRAERTCHDANTRFNAWTCSECKCTQLLVFDDYGEPTLSIDGVASVPHYCPNCGRKVVEE